MKLTKKQRFIGFILLFILGLSVFLKVPDCYYPDFEVQVKKVEEEDIAKTQNVLEEQGTISKYLSGLSMYPTLRPGQICSCIKTDDYQVRDIVSFYIYEGSNPIFVSHRIHEVLPDGQIITKGDNNWKIDSWTITENEIFCEIEHISYLEYFLREAIR